MVVGVGMILVDLDLRDDSYSKYLMVKIITVYVMNDWI